MNKLDKDYQALLQDILDNGVTKQDRTGTGTLSVFGRQIRHNMKDGKFPLLTTKKMYFKGIVTELLWFLRGSTNIKFLIDNDCHIWDGDAYKRYEREYERGNAPGETLLVQRVDGKSTKRKLSIEKFIAMIQHDDEFAKKWGELGPIYGKQWRSWTEYSESKMGTAKYERDQIQNLINDLKTNPDSRRLMVSAWNVGELDQMVLPPCHYGFQVYTRELSHQERYKAYNKIYQDRCTADCYTKEDFDNKNIPTRAISLMWNQRSVDTFLGLPFNIASYGLLLEIIAKEVNMVSDELIGNLGDTHLYSNHIEQAKEQIGREYTPDERSEMLKEAMGYENYHKAIEELMPFGGGLSEYYEQHKIPKHTREPYPLPTLNIFEPAIGKEISILDNLHIWSPTCFIIENYQSHPTIKAPLSN